MRGVQAVGDLDGEREEALRRQRALRQDLVEGRALEQLHRDEVVAVLCSDVVDRADVRVVQDRGRARLALESLDGLRPVEHLLGDELQGDVTAEPDVLGLVDDAHAALAEHLENAVVGDRLAYHGVSGLDREMLALASETGSTPRLRGERLAAQILDVSEAIDGSESSRRGDSMKRTGLRVPLAYEATDSRALPRDGALAARSG